MNRSNRIVFLGAGNMAEALVRGILAAGLRTAREICMTDVLPERLEDMRTRYGVDAATNNPEALDGAEMIFICVKPQQIPELLPPLAGLAPGALWVSIAAGVQTATLERLLGGNARVVRVMPNTPALVQRGAAGIAPGSRATEDDLSLVERCLNSVGLTVRVSEEDLHAVTALSGSGPAYVFYLVEAMLAAAKDLGFPADAARALVVQTVRGAAELLAETGDAPELLRQRVTSKGGTTAAAVAFFDEHDVRQSISGGVLAAARRSRELAAQ